MSKQLSASARHRRTSRLRRRLLLRWSIKVRKSRTGHMLMRSAIWKIASYRQRQEGHRRVLKYLHQELARHQQALHRVDPKRLHRGKQRRQPRLKHPNQALDRSRHDVRLQLRRWLHLEHRQRPRFLLRLVLNLMHCITWPPVRDEAPSPMAPSR